MRLLGIGDESVHSIIECSTSDCDEEVDLHAALIDSQVADSWWDVGGLLYGPCCAGPCDYCHGGDLLSEMHTCDDGNRCRDCQDERPCRDPRCEQTI